VLVGKRLSAAARARQLIEIFILEGGRRSLTGDSERYRLWVLKKSVIVCLFRLR